MTAAVGGCSWPAGAGSRQLEDLVDVHLLQCPRPDRYRFHDLLRTYAATTSATTEPEPARRAALTRLYDYYTYAARVATDACYRQAAEPRPDLPPPATTRSRARPPRGRGSLARRRARQPAGGGGARNRRLAPAHGPALSGILFRHLDHQSHLADAERLHTHAHTAAGRTGDHTGQAHALRFLAIVHARRGRIEPARHHFRQALALYQTAEHRAGQAHALYGLGLVSVEADDFHQALDYCRQALSLYRQAGETVNLARVLHAETLNNLGHTARMAGRADQARAYHQQALALANQLGTRYEQARAHDRLAHCHTSLDQTRRHRRQALDIYAELKLRS